VKNSLNLSKCVSNYVDAMLMADRMDHCLDMGISLGFVESNDIEDQKIKRFVGAYGDIAMSPFDCYRLIEEVDNCTLTEAEFFVAKEKYIPRSLTEYIVKLAGICLEGLIKKEISRRRTKKEWMR